MVQGRRPSQRPPRHKPELPAPVRWPLPDLRDVISRLRRSQLLRSFGPGIAARRWVRPRPDRRWPAIHPRDDAVAPRPRRAGDGCAAHQYFAIRPQLHLASGQRLADGSPCHVEGMVQRDQRRCLRHPIALHHHKAHRVPELLQRPGSAPPPEIMRPELCPNARWTSRKRHQRRRGADILVGCRPRARPAVHPAPASHSR